MSRLLMLSFVALLAGSLQAGVGGDAPDFEFLRSWNLPGGQTRMSDFRGRPVLLEAFASW